MKKHSYIQVLLSWTNEQINSISRFYFCLTNYVKNEKMKNSNEFSLNIKKYSLKLVFLLVFLTFTILSPAQTLEQKVLLKIDSLKNYITTAQTNGIDVQKEKMTVSVAQIFLKYATSDAANIPANASYFAQVPKYAGNSTKLAQDLPDFERNEVITMLIKSIAEIKSVLSGQLKRQPTPVIDWSQVSIVGDQVLFNAKPVFLSDYIWKPNVSELTGYFGNLDASYLTPNYVSNESGVITSATITSLQNKATGRFGSVFMDHTTVPQWAISKYPNLQAGARSYTKYDIDNAGARVLQKFLLKGTIPLMAGKNYSKMGYMLCNEPHWHTAAGSFDTGTVSDSTIAKFRIWLKSKHTTIAELNSLWGSNFSNFSTVTTSIPMSTSLRGTPQWYDWMAFNMDRVTDWFTFLHNEIIKSDNTARTHIKVMPSDWGYSDYDNGLDMEALMKLSEILGNDAGAATSNRNSTHESWMDRYSFSWREMCPFYDFCKSVGPDKIMINSETHFLSGYNFRDLYLTPEYTRAITWLAAMQGMNVAQTWVWGRYDDGSINSSTGEGYAGSIIQQPRVLHEVEATTMDLNANSDAISAMQRLRKPLRIFYSKTSAINNSTYMDNIFTLYESLFFNGIPLGYATKGIINEQDNSKWDAILIYQTPNVTLDELKAVQAYLNNGGTVIIDNVSMKKDEYNRPLVALTSGNGQLIASTSLSYLTYKAMQSLKSTSIPEVTVAETNTVGSNGCVWKCVKTEQGTNILSIVNTGKSVATLDINLKNAKSGTLCRDILKGILVSSKPKLNPNEVYFVEIKDSLGATGINNLINDDVEFVKLYPSQVDGTLKIYFSKLQKDVEMTVFNLNGCIVKNEKFNEVKEISNDINTLSKGAFFVKLISKQQSKTLFFIKN